jgi:hypothetical protein
VLRWVVALFHEKVVQTIRVVFRLENGRGLLRHLLEADYNPRRNE